MRPQLRAREPEGMTTDRVPLAAVVFLLVSAAVGAGAALFTFGFLSEYGITSGSRAEGSLGGLRFAAVPLLVTAALGAAAFVLGRRSAWLPAVALAVVLLSVGGAVAAGAQAAVVKYDRLPRLPHCYDEEFAGSEAEPVARAVQDAFVGLEHPWRFSGGGSTGLDGCATTLLDVTFDEAAALPVVQAASMRMMTRPPSCGLTDTVMMMPSLTATISVACWLVMFQPFSVSSPR